MCCSITFRRGEYSGGHGICSRMTEECCTHQDAATRCARSSATRKGPICSEGDVSPMMRRKTFRLLVLLLACVAIAAVIECRLHAMPSAQQHADSTGDHSGYPIRDIRTASWRSYRRPRGSSPFSSCGFPVLLYGYSPTRPRWRYSDRRNIWFGSALSYRVASYAASAKEELCLPRAMKSQGALTRRRHLH